MRLISCFLLALAVSCLLSCEKRGRERDSTPLTLQPPESGRQIIFDTDSAYFSDDGVALAMLLQAGVVDILGVTVTAGNHRVPQGVEFMLHIFEIFNLNSVPLFAGEESPLLAQEERVRALDVQHKALFRQKSKQQGEESQFESWLGSLGTLRDEIIYQSGKKPEKIREHQGSAVDFLIKTIREQPGEITVVALGPMTNIAAAFERSPGLDELVKELIFMGGALTEGGVLGNASPVAELNFWFDAAAAHAVLASNVPRKIMFGLGITNQAPFRYEDFARIAFAQPSTPLTELFRDDMGNHTPGFLQRGDEGRKQTWWVWDALVAAYLVDPSVVLASKKFFLQIVPEIGLDMGRVLQSSVERPGYAEVEVMTKLDRRAALDLYTRLLTQPLP